MSAEAEQLAFGSNNPFRRRSTGSSANAISTSAFAERETKEDAPALAPAPVPTPAPVKAKVVKRVRVQSPPPSSPDSAPPPIGELRYEDESSDSDESGDGEDPFEGAEEEDGEESRQPADQPLNRPPLNPFSKTLQDMEQAARGGEKPATPQTSAGAVGKGSLDVDAFRRLLLTGQTNVSSSGPGQPSPSAPQSNNPTPQVVLGDAGSITDASSVSRQSIFDKEPTSTTTVPQETPRTSHEISESESDEHLPSASTPVPTQQRKKPPPPAPSSRHGKLIKIELKEGGMRSPGSKEDKRPGSSASISSSQKSPSDMNKPLPPAPMRHSADEELESVFDREAAGKLPEPAAPTPPPNSTVVPGSGKKPTPAPPPRRHTRSESKTPTVTGLAVGSTPQEDDQPSRSSLESQRSRADSFRFNSQIPAPPPPRRPHPGSRQSSTFTSPSALSPTSGTPAISPSTDADGSPTTFPAPQTYAPLDAASKVTIPKESHTTPIKFAPPPPPTRNSSTRRPPSVHSLEAVSRRIPAKDKDNSAAPPPPPPRTRGGSRGSTDAPSIHRHPSGDSMRVLGASVTEEPVAEVDEAVDPASQVDILADLDALQREVDALRGKYEEGSVA